MTKKTKAVQVEKKGAGRPRKEIDFTQLEKLCELQATENEICEWFGINTDTLSTRCKEQGYKDFSDFFAQKRGRGKIALRRAQYQAALGDAEHSPNPTMLIWLGKQYLEQKDKNELSGSLTPPEMHLTLEGAGNGPETSAETK